MEASLLSISLLLFTRRLSRYGYKHSSPAVEAVAEHRHPLWPRDQRLQDSVDSPRIFCRAQKPVAVGPRGCGIIHTPPQSAGGFLPGTSAGQQPGGRRKRDREKRGILNTNSTNVPTPLKKRDDIFDFHLCICRWQVEAIVMWGFGISRPITDPVPVCGVPINIRLN